MTNLFLANKHLKVCVDPSGLFAATTSQDRSLRLYDITQGTLIGRVTAHSELITGVKFSPCCTCLVSVGGDGCIFVWKLAPEITQAMKKQHELISNNIPRLVALKSWPTPVPAEAGGAKTRTTTLPLTKPQVEFQLDAVAFPAWAQKRCSELIVGEDKENQHVMMMMVNPKQPSRMRSRWMRNSQLDVYASMVDKLNLTPITEFSKCEVNIPKKTLGSMDFSIDLDSSRHACDETVPEEDVMDTEDNSFVSVEDSAHDFLMEDFESFQAKLPPPNKNSNRLSLSAQFHEQSTCKKSTTIHKTEDSSSNSIGAAPATSSASSTVSGSVGGGGSTSSGTEDAKRTKWQQDVERTRQRLIELGLYDGTTRASSNSATATPTQQNTATETSPTTTLPITTTHDAALTQTQPTPLEQLHSNQQQPEVQQQQEEEEEAMRASQEEIAESGEQSEDDYYDCYEDEEEEDATSGTTGMDGVAIDLFIAQFKGMFDQTLSLYYNLASVSRGTCADASQQEALGKLEHLFGHVRSSLEDIVPTPAPNPVMELLLQRYSEKLVDMVKGKLEPTTIASDST